jgi:hypothetical protein
MSSSKSYAGRFKWFLAAAVIALIGLSCYLLLNKHRTQAARLSEARKEVTRLTEKKAIQDGDIIFQTSQSGQSKAIQQATHSPYSHCGLIFGLGYGSGMRYYVLEAVQPVKWTSLDAWIAHGQGGHYTIKRLHSDPVLPPSMFTELRIAGEKYLGRPYDMYFGWGDDRIYCSELVWKVYHQVTGLEIGKLQQLKDFDLSGEAVQKKLKERYGNHLPLRDTVISPASIFDSELLETVKVN